MSGCRKFLGVFVIAFIGIPVLLAIIWAVGLTRAVVSSEFFTEVPQKLIAHIPKVLDEVMAEAEQEGVVEDENAHAWIKAMADADTKPQAVLESTGFMTWLKKDLAGSLDNIGKIFRGEMRPQVVYLDMRPLKAALLHKDLELYLLQLLKKLPPCTEADTQLWVDAALQENYCSKLPACRPADPEKALEIIKLRLAREVEKMPDQEDIFHVKGRFRHNNDGIWIARTVVSLTFLLFLIPALFIGLGSLLGSSSSQGFMRWMGYSTLIGGGLAFGIAKIATHAMRYGSEVGPFSYSEFHCNIPVNDTIMNRCGEIAYEILNPLFYSVDRVAGIVCIVGIVMIALSYLLFSEKKVGGTGQPKNPSGPQPTSQPTPPPTAPTPEAPAPETPTPETPTPAAPVNETTVQDSTTPPPLPDAEPQPQATLPPTTSYPLDGGSQTYPGLK